MKPLLRSAPLTPEDFAIFARPTSDLWTAFERGALTALYLRQDRRDADLMLEAQRHPNWVRSEYGHFTRSIAQAIRNNPEAGQW